MIQVRRILCPTDFSDHSRLVVARAVELARFWEAEVRFLHVLPIVPSAMAVFPPVPAVDLDPVPRGRVLEGLRDLSRPAEAAGVRCDVELRDGGAAAQILDAASAWPADLLVMGTHGRGGIERLVLGSVAETVLRKASCPVLTVPPPAPGVSGEPLFATILCAVDFSPASMKALQYALSLAQVAKASLTLLHVVERPGGAQPDSLGMPGYPGYLEERARLMLRGAVPDEARLWCDIDERVATGKAHLEIERAAREKKTDLIVMGVQGRGGVDLMLFGSTTHHVIREAHVPVLSIRSDERIGTGTGPPAEQPLPF